MINEGLTEVKRKMLFMNYKEILEYFRIRNIKNKAGGEITLPQLQVAVCKMVNRHPDCEWQSERVQKRYHYVLSEGVMWLEKVYYDFSKPTIDLEIIFFENRILWYREFCKSRKIDFGDFEFIDSKKLSMKTKRRYLKELENEKIRITNVCVKNGLPFDFFMRN